MIKGWAVGARGEVLEYTGGTLAGTWVSVPAGIIHTLRGVTVVEDPTDSEKNTVWAVGNYGTIISKNIGAGSWVTQKQVKGPKFIGDLYSVGFSSPQIGFAVGVNGGGLKTVDGGETWTPFYLGTDSWLRSIRFFDENNGWITGTEGALFSTSDGGITWQERDPQTSEWVRSVFFLDQTEGWLVGSNGLLRKTTNGGLTWDIEDVNEPEDEREPYKCLEIYAQDLWLESSSTALVVANAGNIFRTTDGGKKWEIVPNTKNDENEVIEENVRDENGNLIMSNLRSIAGIGSEVWVAGSYGTILHSADAGVTWDAKVVGNNNLYSISMISL